MYDFRNKIITMFRINFTFSLQKISERVSLAYFRSNKLFLCKFVVSTRWTWWHFVMFSKVYMSTTVGTTVSSVSWLFTCFYNFAHNLPPNFLEPLINPRTNNQPLIIVCKVSIKICMGSKSSFGSVKMHKIHKKILSKSPKRY